MSEIKFIQFTPETINALQALVGDSFIDKYLPMLTTLVGILIGGAITLCTTIYLEKRRRKESASAMKEAFKDEIKVMVGIMIRRGLLGQIEQGLLKTLNNKLERNKLSFFFLNPSISLIKDNGGNFGLLEREFAQAIIIFYQTITTFVSLVAPSSYASVQGLDAKEFKDVKNCLMETLAVANYIIGTSDLRLIIQSVNGANDVLMSGLFDSYRLDLSKPIKEALDTSPSWSKK